jgi:2-dehydropantoate 2-reductase
MACLFAARMSAAGIRIMMLGSWPEGLAALRKNGVRLVSADGEESVFPVRVTDQTDACRNIPLALILVKSWQTERVAHQLAAFLPRDGLVLTLQNGLGNREILVRALGNSRVLIGATTTGAHLLAPGVARLAGDGVVSLGVSAQSRPMADLLRRAGFIVETVPDIASLQWSKLVINAAINPLTALLKIPNGELLERPSAAMLMSAVSREAAAVAVALGISLPYPDPALAAEAIARRTASNQSSMLQDVLRGALTEIDQLNGEIIRAGERVGVPTPLNRTLWLLIKSLGGR